MRSFVWVWLAACAPDTEPEDGITLLEPREQLIRLSIDLRGVFPTESELVAIEEHPSLYADFVDRYLQDARFPDRMTDLFHLRYLTRTGDLSVDADSDELGLPEEVVAASLAEEPLALVRRVIAEDLPYDQVVLADYTMADPITAWMWGIERPVPEVETGEFLPSHYTDGREHAGVLTMTTLWTRYPSAGVNSNRHRANAVSRILLCDDYLARPVSFARTQIDALTSGDPEDVIRDTPTCQSCHSSLDPLAAHFYGFWWEVDGDFRDQTTYRPEDEPMWRDHANKPPGYFGRPTYGIRELAEQIAADERFERCAVKTVFEGLTQRSVSDADWAELAPHQAAFDEGVVRELVRSIVLSRAYLAAQDDHDRVTLKMVSPAVLESVIYEKTGYRWTMDGRPALASNVSGLAVLGGGIDARFVTRPSHDPSVGMVLIQERLAQGAGREVATHDLDPEREGEAVLLDYVNQDMVPETHPVEFDQQIRALYLELTAAPLSDEDPQVEALIDLWKRAYSVEGSAETAWAGVISVVLRDPRLLFY